MSAQIPGSYDRLFELINPCEGLVLWLWRDDLRHRPLWLIRRKVRIAVVAGEAANPRPVNSIDCIKPPEHRIGTISHGGAVTRTRSSWEEGNLELRRLCDGGLRHARA